jgi:hypothetical protein
MGFEDTRMEEMVDEVPLGIINGTLAYENTTFPDVDLSMDANIVGYYDNLSSLECILNNYTYLNVTCEPGFDLSLPLLGNLDFFCDNFKINLSLLHTSNNFTFIT